MKDLSEKYPDVDFVYPMHLNPNVRKPIRQVFGDHPSENLHFIEPLDYLDFVCLMSRSYIALEAGTVKLVGTDYDRIVLEVSSLLENPAAYDAMSHAVNPYGDGKACPRIVEKLK